MVAQCLYCLLHLTLQEYLAALHWSRMGSEDMVNWLVRPDREVKSLANGDLLLFHLLNKRVKRKQARLTNQSNHIL